MDTVRVGLRPLLTVLAVMLAAASAPAAGEVTDLRKQALALNDITGEKPIKGQIQALVDDPAGTRKLLTAAAALAREKDQPFNYTGSYILASAARRLKEGDAAEAFYRLCIDQAEKLKSGKKLAESYTGLINYYYDAKKFAEAEKLCRKFLELDDEDGQTRRGKSQMLSLLILTLAKQGKADEALKLVDNLLKVRSDDWVVLDLKAEVLREVGRAAEAAKAYEQTLEGIAKDKSLKNEERDLYLEQGRYILSNLYVELNQIDKATEHFKALLAVKPNDPTFNNDLGYVWADHDQNLAEAEKLIRKALDEDRKQRKAKAVKPEEDKDNAAFLDSLGWVLYKQKKFKEAKPVLQTAVQDKGGQHAEIFDHLGDVCLAMGEKGEAVAAWKKAVSVSGTSKRDQDRKARIEKKLKENQ